MLYLVEMMRKLAADTHDKLRANHIRKGKTLRHKQISRNFPGGRGVKVVFAWGGDYR